MDVVAMRALIREEFLTQKLQIYSASTNSQFEVQRFSLNLGTANSNFPIPFPFKSIAFVKGTDVNTEVEVIFNDVQVGISKVPFKDNSSLFTDRMFDSAVISWAAQPGKSLECLVFLNSKYESGAFLNSGTVSVQPQTAFTTTLKTMVASTAQLLQATSTSTKKVSIQNKTGASLWLGPSSSVSLTAADPNLGFELANGDTFISTNQANIYGISPNAGDVVVMQET